MKIEEFKKGKISAGDIDYIKNKVEENYQCEGNIQFDVFDKKLFIELCFYVDSVLRNCQDKKAFEIVLKIAYKLIDMGEKYLKENYDFSVEVEIANLYHILGFIIYLTDDYGVVPYYLQGENFEIEKDCQLAVQYWKKAHLLNPNSKEVCYDLGEHYFYSKQYEKAFAYLINTKEFCCGEWLYCATEHSIINTEEFVKLGEYFIKSYKKSHELIDGENAFLCFERAYLIAKENKFENKKLTKDILYNLAYVYIEGIGTKKNRNKGLKYLKILDEKLSKQGGNIHEIKDNYKIIEKYYK